MKFTFLKLFYYNAEVVCSLSIMYIITWGTNGTKRYYFITKSVISLYVPASSEVSAAQE